MDMKHKMTVTVKLRKDLSTRINSTFSKRLAMMYLIMPGMAITHVYSHMVRPAPERVTQ